MSQKRGESSDAPHFPEHRGQKQRDEELGCNTRREKNAARKRRNQFKKKKKKVRKTARLSAPEKGKETLKKGNLKKKKVAKKWEKKV